MKYVIGLLICILLIPMGIAAQEFQFDPGGSIASTLNLPKGDAQNAAIQTVQYILGLLGLLAVVVIIYGGFRYLTSAGNEETVKHARAVLKTAVIGLIVILLSWAIIIFVFGSLSF